MTEPSTTRRGVLSVVGATLLGGCSGPDFDTDDDSETIRALRLRDVVPEDADPVVVDSLPVEIESSTLVASAQRVDELLAGLPIPFGPENVPNGHIRQRLTEAAAEATDRVGEARTAPSRLVAFTELRQARSEARYAAAGWAFVDRGLTEAELRSDHQATVSEAESFRSELEYLGSDPVTAALVYGQVERFLSSVLDDGPRSQQRESSQLLTVAEWGAHAESTRAQLDAARYLYDRFQSTLSDDVGSIDRTLSAAIEALRPEFRDRRESLPMEPSDEENRLKWRLWDDIWSDVESSVERLEEARGPATALLVSTRGFTALGAYDRLADHINDGQLRPETAADVRDIRTAAVAAITAARESSPRVDLARPILAEAARSVTHADNRLRRFSGDVRPTQLDYAIVQYLAATLRARSVPTASRTVLDALNI